MGHIIFSRNDKIPTMMLKKIGFFRLKKRMYREGLLGKNMYNNF